jgi:methylated-DNA-[protein]-cysteine S-methyltransferase
MSGCSAIESPWGLLKMELATGVVRSLEWAVDTRPALVPVTPPAPLRDYFDGQLNALEEMAIQPQATPFQQRVWQALRAIAAGSVVSYGEIARSLATAPRAVGGACRSNRIVLIVPCHRVVARHGIGGYAGAWGEGESVARKRALLRHEGWSSGEAR